jgi:hypothetical protein
MAEKLTIEEIQAKADALSVARNVKVHPLVFIDPKTEEQIVGYIEEPNRATKTRVLDKGLISPVTAASELMDVVLIKEESNPRIYSEKSEDDSIYLGAVMACYETIKVSVNQIKKN